MQIESFKKNLGRIVLPLIALAVLAGSYFRLLDNYELETLDVRFRLRPQIPATDKIAIIEIGDDTIKKLGRFPFDRSYHAMLVSALSDAGAKDIVFDIFFSEPHESDAAFTEAIKKAANVYFPVVFDLDYKNIKKVPVSSQYAAENLEDITLAGKGAGHINVIPDLDGKFRRAPAYIKYGEFLYPYLSLLFTCDYFGIPQKNVTMEPGKFVDLGNGTRIPLDDNSTIIVNFSGKWGRSYKHYSYVDILQSYLAKTTGEEPNVDLAGLKGKVCIIGLTAVGTVDLHPTPFDTLYPAMGMHAEVFNSIINKRFIARASREVNIAILLLLALLISVLVLKTKPLKGFLVLFAVIFVFVLASLASFNFFGIWIDMIYPILAMVMLHLSLTIYKYVREWKRRLLMENELQIAKKIQESFLPKAMPSVDGVDIAASMFTARQVGGDLYDFTSFGEGRFGVMIGDVSGKGVPAALFMAMVVGAFKTFATPAAKPEEVLSHLNSKLEKESSSNLFVTVYYSIFDMKDKVFVYGNGGHLPVLYLDREGRSQFLDVEEGAPLGLMDGSYSGKRINFDKGDTFIYYTDGITEAMNPKSDMYGSQRLLAAAEKARHLPADKLAEAIEKDVRKFEPKSQQHDDITVIVVKIV